MKILIAGSRTIHIPSETMLNDLNDFLNHIGSQKPVTEFISGGALGVDRCAEQLAFDLNVPMTINRPDWKTHGKKAGILRNQIMVDACNAALIYYDGVSKGTASTIKMLQKTTKPYIIIMIEKEINEEITAQ